MNNPPPATVWRVYWPPVFILFEWYLLLLILFCPDFSLNFIMINGRSAEKWAKVRSMNSVIEFPPFLPPFSFIAQHPILEIHLYRCPLDGHTISAPKYYARLASLNSVKQIWSTVLKVANCQVNNCIYATESMHGVTFSVPVHAVRWLAEVSNESKFLS